MRLTDPFIKALKAPESGAVVYPDDGFAGFGVRVSEGGTKSYVLTHGKLRRRETIGRVGTITLAKAREKAKIRLAEYTLGKSEAASMGWAKAVPPYLVSCLADAHDLRGEAHDDSRKLWNFSRPTAWRYVKNLMRVAAVSEDIAKPRALRHAFGVEAVQRHIALSVVKKWLGHAKIETTAIYADPVGEEERKLARLMWAEEAVLKENKNDRF